MNLVHKVFFSIIVGAFFVSLPAKAQQDSTNLRLRAGRVITDRFPSTRFLNVEYEYLTPVDYKTKLYGQPWENGKLEGQNRIKVNMNIPLYKTKKWVFTGSLRYKYSYSEFNDQVNVSTQYPDLYSSKSNDSHTFNVALNSTYIARIFNKPLVYNFAIVGDASQEGFERMSASAIATMVFKRTQNLAITGGLIVIVDKMARYPVLPVFGLEYKFSDNWMISVAMPQYVYIRKSFSNNARLSFGTNLDSDRYYVYPKEYNKSFIYNKAEARTGFVYEQYLQKHFILNVRAGMLNTFKGTLNRKNESYNKHIISSTQDAGAYFNIGISYNLF